MSNEEINTSGFDAIHDKVQELYPNQEANHYATIIKYQLGGNDPLDGVDVWKSEKGMPHWHYVTYGFTELYEKESDYKEISGYGFELTFRLKREENEETPPQWPINLLQNIARYVFSSGNTFDDGHHMNCNGPIMLDSDTKLTALGFRVDPELGELDTPNGKFTFLQMIALTHDEMEAQMCWNGTKFLSAMEKYVPYNITIMERNSLLENKEFYQLWQNGVDKDGSSTGFLYTDFARIEQIDKKTNLFIGAGHIQTLLTMLNARIGKDKPLLYCSNTDFIEFTPNQTSSIKQEIEQHEDYTQEKTIINLTKENLKEINNILKPKQGIYTLQTMPLVFNVEKTEIRDYQGNITEIIG